jgi:hypothetical protein
MTTRTEFSDAALAMADRLDIMPIGTFVRWSTIDANGIVTLPRPQYDDIAGEWIELLTPFGLGRSGPDYEVVARRGWDNAGLIADASWEDAIHIAGTLARAQRTRGDGILEEAQKLGMLSAILRRLALLADGPDGAQRFARSKDLFSLADAPPVGNA